MLFVELDTCKELSLLLSRSEVWKHTHLPKIMKMSVTGRNKLLSET